MKILFGNPVALNILSAVRKLSRNPMIYLQAEVAPVDWSLELWITAISVLAVSMVFLGKVERLSSITDYFPAVYCHLFEQKQGYL